MAGIRLSAAPNDLRGLIYAINKMDKATSNELRNEVASISKWSAQGIIQSSYGAPMPAQTAIVASSVRAVRDRIPNVQVGGTRGRKTSNGTPAGVLVKGNEFGAYPTSKAGRFPNGGRRFPFRSPRKGAGNAGYWIYPELERQQPEITRRWKQAVDKVLDNWGKY